MVVVQSVLSYTLCAFSPIRSLLCPLAFAPKPPPEGDWPLQTYRTEPFQIPSFHVVKSTNTTADGFFFVGVELATGPRLKGAYIVRDTGELVWHGATDFDAYYNFQTQSLNGDPVLSFWTGRTYETHGYGSISILDDTYKLIHEICLPHSENIVTPVPMPRVKCFADKHESFITKRNSIIVPVYNTTQTDLTSVGGPEKGWIYDCLFYELDIETNQILFKWSALENIGIATSNYLNPNGKNKLQFPGGQTGFEKSRPWDFFHINSIEPIDGGYIVNSRMTWAFYLIDGRTGRVNYTIEGSNGGDFSLQDSIFFSWQHHARLESISDDHSTLHISLFNNDNVPQILPNRNHSSAYLLSLNKTSKEVYALRHLYHPPPSKHPIYAHAEGSYQNLPNGHALIGYGAEPFIQEFDADDRLVYSAQYGQTTGDTAPAGMHSYRIFRLPWRGNPRNLPKAVASASGFPGEFLVYMSWNGATAYAGWHILAGVKPDLLDPVQKYVPKAGFETEYRVQGGFRGYQFIMVQAVGSDGEVLANSTVVEIE